MYCRNTDDEADLAADAADLTTDITADKAAPVYSRRRRKGKMRWHF